MKQQSTQQERGFYALEVRAERTEWRDLELSKRHREWGYDCPAIDIDFLLIEYDKGLPVAIVEYKHELAAKQDFKHPSYRALQVLANEAKLPLFYCRYREDFSVFQARPLNFLASGYLPAVHDFSEKEWVSFLYFLRRRTTSKGA